MTKDEVIEVLKNAIWLGEDVDREKLEEAVCIAIASMNMWDTLESYLEMFIRMMRKESDSTYNDGVIGGTESVLETVRNYKKGIFE